MEMTNQEMERFQTIGKVAQRVGVSATTVRIWEAQANILPYRTSSGLRLYDEQMVQALCLYRHSQRLCPRSSVVSSTPISAPIPSRCLLALRCAQTSSSALHPPYRSPSPPPCAPTSFGNRSASRRNASSGSDRSIGAENGWRHSLPVGQ